MTRHIVQRQTPVGAPIAFVVAAAAMTVPPVVAAKPAPETNPESVSGAGANQLRTEEQEMTTTAIAEGSKVRLTRALDDWFGTTRPAGFEFTVSEFCRALNEHDHGYGDPEYIQCDFYYGDANGGCNNMHAPADAVELVMDVEAMNARKLPTLAQFAREVGSELCGMDADNFETDETSQEGNGVVLVAGETREGLRFAAYVQVLRIEHADF